MNNPIKDSVTNQIQNRRIEVEQKYRDLLINYSILQHFFDEAYLDLTNSMIYSSFFSLAIDLAERLPLGQETENALRKLLEARDAAIRSSVHYVSPFTLHSYQRSMTQFSELKSSMEKNLNL